MHAQTAQYVNAVQLPEDLQPNEFHGVQVIDYEVAKESTKQQVNLSLNTFSFLREGHKEVMSDSTSISISNSDFLLMKAGKCLMTEKFATNDYYRSILLFFPDEAVLQFAQKYDIQLLKNAERKSVQRIAYDPFIQSFVEGISEPNELSPDAQNRLLQVKFEELMIYLTDTLGTEFLSSLILDMDDQSHRFLEVVESNKLNKLTLNELAFLSNMSLSTFKRAFEKHFEESPSKWFQERRLEYAAFLLKNKAMRASDIYEEIGYDSLSNFIQTFKNKFGNTPKQYTLN